MQINGIDHLVLTVADMAATVDFYTRVMGMKNIEFGAGRVALIFGEQKINLHQLGKEFEPKAGKVQTGSADLCFIIDGSVDEAIAHLRRHDVDVIEGPVERTGARGRILSAYFRDPDENLIEVSTYYEAAIQS